MLKIIKKAADKRVGCDLIKVVASPLVEKRKFQTYKIECGLNASICGNGEIKKIS